MQDKVKFEYAIIRVVPKVEREEFLNVGVILFCKRKKYLEVKYHIDPIKLSAFSNELEVIDLIDYLKAWEKVCKGKSDGGKLGELELPDRFRWLTASRSTIIQSSQPHAGLCENPDQVLSNLYEEFVA